VTGCLLDTNIVLIALADADRLTRAVRSAVLRGPNVLSAVTFWEVTLKASRGKLDVGDPRVWWETALGDLAATSLPLRAEHVAELQNVRYFTAIRSTAFLWRKQPMKISPW
jgi:PIN domain nuclease of toxin-antitoxin system